MKRHGISPYRHYSLEQKERLLRVILTATSLKEIQQLAAILDHLTFGSLKDLAEVVKVFSGGR